MSIQIQACGIATLLILLFFQDRQRKTHLITERVFRWVILTALVCLVMDAGFILAIRWLYPPAGGLAAFGLDLVCKLYLITLPGIGVSTLLYICSDLFATQPRALQRRAAGYGLMALCFMLVILALPIAYDLNELGQVTNTNGPSVYATYASVTVLLALNAFYLIRDRHHLNRRRGAVLVWMGLWVGSFVIQLVNNRMLLAGFACSAGILVIFLSLENPEANFDKQTGLLTHGVMLSYLTQLYAEKRDFTVLQLIFVIPHHQLSAKNAGDMKADLGRYLDGHREWMAFRQGENKFLFLCDDQDEALRAKEEITRYVAQLFPDPSEMPMRLHWLLLPSGRVAADRKELIYLLQHIVRKHYFDTDLLVADDKLVGEVRRDLEVESFLDAAMSQDRIEVFYQPIYSTRERRITSAEALVRIRDDQGQLVPPGLFIPIAEANGMILPLGRMIFDRVCRFIKRHPLDELGLRYIEVNLSVVQCASDDLATDYIDIMRRYGISPQHINLEITESASTAEKKILLRNMDKLIDFGTTFSLDDFGTGQSNLDYIMDMPVQIAKFDRSMTQAYFVNDRARQIMNAAVRMVHDMGLKIVSEGVETLEECQAIEALGIEYIQGFYFSKPLPEAEFLAYLDAFQPPAPAPEREAQAG